MTPADARAAIRALRVGAAPVSQASILSIGQAPLRIMLERAMHRMSSCEALEPILIEGHWGSGKSQMLALAKAIARAGGIATGAMTFNARTTPLSHPNRLYPVLAQTIEAAGATGLRSLVRRMLHDEHLNDRVADFGNGRSDAFGAALRTLHQAHALGDTLLLGHSTPWSILLGGDLTLRDDQGRKSAAVLRMAALAELMGACGFGGLVILGDELESLGQLWSSASRASAYNAMGSLFALPSVLWVLGAAGNFQRMVDFDIGQGMPTSWRLKNPGHSFFVRWSAGEFRRLSPPSLGRKEGDHLAGLIAELYEVGYGPDHRRVGDSLAAVVRAWCEDPGRNPRRLARGIVEKLDQARD